MRCGCFAAVISILAGCGSTSAESADNVGSGGSSDSTGGTAGGVSATSGASAGVVSSGGVTRGTSGGSTATGGIGESTGGKAPADPAPTVPVIDSLFAAIDDTGAIGIEFAGRVGDAQVRRVIVDLLDAAGNAIDQQYGWGSWLSRPNRFFGSGSAGHLEQAGDRFSGFMALRDSTLSELPERVRVTIQDIEEDPGEPVEAVLSAPSPATRGDGELCDPFGVLSRCEGEALCDVVDGSDRVAPSCQTPTEECPKPMLELRDTIQASNEAAPDDTDSSCTFSRGNLGNDQGHVFVASKSGSHRFRAQEIDYEVAVTLYARRFCNFGRAPESELGCVHKNDVEAGEPLELVLDLEAGQTVFVYVEATWVGGGEYVLSVEEPS